MRLIGFACLVSLTIVTACSDEETGQREDSGETAPTSSDAARIIEESVTAMEALDSYRQHFTFRPEGRTATFLVDYADPKDWYERYPASESGEAFEIILLGDKGFGRSCEDYPDTCEPWSGPDERGPGDKVPGAGGFTTTAPEILGLSALESVRDAAILGSDDDSLIHIEGSVKLAKLILDNQLRAYGDVEEYEEHCESSGRLSDGSRPTATCTYLSFEEYLEKEHADTDFESEPDSPLHVWIARADFRVHRLVIGLPGGQLGQEPDENERYFEVSYSDFNEVTIEAPEGAVPAD
jgi:hypothetical protein